LKYTLTCQPDKTPLQALPGVARDRPLRCRHPGRVGVDAGAIDWRIRQDLAPGLARVTVDRVHQVEITISPTGSPQSQDCGV